MLRYKTVLIRRTNVKGYGDTPTGDDDEIENAEKNIIRYVQGRSYKRELLTLQKPIKTITK